MSSAVPPPLLKQLCRIAVAPPCVWTAHRYKHKPFDGMTRAHTRNPNPARYLDPKTIREIELATVRAPIATGREGTFAEYLRDAGGVIGWDDGADASYSYVECSGGETAGRSFHGRPMHMQNKIVVRLRGELGK